MQIEVFPSRPHDIDAHVARALLAERAERGVMLYPSELARLGGIEADAARRALVDLVARREAEMVVLDADAREVARMNADAPRAPLGACHTADLSVGFVPYAHRELVQ